MGVKTKLILNLTDMIKFGTDPYVKNNKLICINMMSGKKDVYDICVSFKLQNLFTDMSMFCSMCNNIILVDRKSSYVVK